MADIVDSAARSRMMSGIRSRNTKPELLLRRSLHAAGFRFRLHRQDLPGTPDMVLPRYRVAVFVHGCFWHHHEGCNNATVPATRCEFWKDKFERNRTRDDLQVALLRQAGWRVAIIWECAIRKSLSSATSYLATWIREEKSEDGISVIPREV